MKASQEKLQHMAHHTKKVKATTQLKPTTLPNNQQFQQKEEAAQEQSSYVQEGLFSYVRMDWLLKRQ